MSQPPSLVLQTHVLPDVLWQFFQSYAKCSKHQVIFANNSATERDTTKLITLFHSESTAHSNDINILYRQKLPKSMKIPLL